MPATGGVCVCVVGGGGGGMGEKYFAKKFLNQCLGPFNTMFLDPPLSSQMFLKVSSIAVSTLILKAI